MTIPATPEQAAALEWLRDNGLSPLQGFMMMREALAFYADNETLNKFGVKPYDFKVYDEDNFDFGVVLLDDGKIARAALEGK